MWKRVLFVQLPHALLLLMEAAMHGEQRRTFHSGMPALGVGAKQRLQRRVLRQPDEGRETRRNKFARAC
jgi:hypothetical protein